MADAYRNPDGTVRLAADRRLLRTRDIDPVVVETRRLHAPWQAEADANVVADRVRMTALINQGCHHVHTIPYRGDRYRSVRWDRPAAPAAD